MPRAKTSNTAAPAAKATKKAASAKEGCGESCRCPRSCGNTCSCCNTCSCRNTCVAAPVEVASPVSTLTTDFTEFMAKLQQVTSMLSSLKTEFRTLEKKATRELRAAQKICAKRKRKAGNRNPSGFVKPTLISNELASFLGKTQGTEMARTEVTREINAYIREHKLQDPQNGRKINADTKLSTLLKLKKGDELTYFNLQKYMSPHFAKATKVVASA